VGLGAYLSRRYFELTKEICDVVVGFVAFLLALPVIGVCALIIKLSSKGPVFFTQTRAGKGGSPFTIYKLRTMHRGAEDDTGAVWAADNDPRIIRACRWMRRSHVDELPQLINVIRGEMSLVGPRPERPEILAELAATYPNVHDRLAVRPGITGLAQIRNGYDTSVEGFRHKLEADLEYIRTRKWTLEVRILITTLARLRDKTSR
jgi:lipopolysaccharide/colanic/teichoic acid biosynthesis glycosyltransferase